MGRRGPVFQPVFRQIGQFPLTFPVRLEDTPTFLNFGSERGRTIYGEDMFVGYHFYEQTKKSVLFPFGHGLSYRLRDRRTSGKHFSDARYTQCVISVRNSGCCDGAYIAQVYVSQRQASIVRPVKELKGFAKIFLQEGEQKTLQIPISFKYATRFGTSKRTLGRQRKEYSMSSLNVAQLMRRC